MCQHVTLRKLVVASKSVQCIKDISADTDADASLCDLYWFAIAVGARNQDEISSSKLPAYSVLTLMTGKSFHWLVSVSMQVCLVAVESELPACLLSQDNKDSFQQDCGWVVVCFTYAPQPTATLRNCIFISSWLAQKWADPFCCSRSQRISAV